MPYYKADFDHGGLCYRGEVEAQLADTSEQMCQAEVAIRTAGNDLRGVTEDRSASIICNVDIDITADIAHAPLIIMS